MSRTPVLVLSDVAFAYGERVLFEGLSLALDQGDKLGLIGDNGVGKSSLLKLILGDEQPLSGDIAVRGGTRIDVLEQVPRLDPSRTIGDVLEEGLRPLLDAIAAWEQASAALDERAEALMVEIENLGGFDYEHRIDDIAGALSLPPRDTTIATLSGGQLKRVAIGRLVLSAPDIVLLDEPTNHLDIDTVEWLERWITSSPATFLVITHDRAFLDRAVTTIAELRSPRRLAGPDLGRGPLAIYPGRYADYLEARALEEEQRAALGHIRGRQLKSELEWARRQPKARTTRSQARLSRVAALQDEVRALGVRDATSRFELEQGAPRLAKTVIRLEQASFGYGDDDDAIVSSLDLTLARGERLGVVGDNGSGKTTLLKLLAGELELRSGRHVMGPKTQVALFDQHRAVLDPEQTILHTLSPDGNDTLYPAGRPTHVASYLERFAFSARHLRMSVAALSGGERNRLALARFLLERANVLCLDEPTNDLDLATLAVLEEALVAFAGTVVVVSHDRWFLDRVATRLLVFERLPPETPGGQPKKSAFIQPGGWTTYRRIRGPELEHMWAAHQEAVRAQARVTRRPSEKKARGPNQAEKRELASLEAHISELEEALGGVSARLEEPAIWTGDGAEGRDLAAERSRLESELEEAMERWSELASKVEAPRS